MNNDFISTSAIYGPHLAHYGIKGQKWGLRRFQNSDGSLTAEGAKRYGSVKEMKKAVKAEYKRDQLAAKSLGNMASQAAWAYKKQAKTVERAIKRAGKKPSDKNLQKRDIETMAMFKLRDIKEGTQKAAERHYNELTKKYGLKAMKDIRRSKDGYIDERNGSLGFNILATILGAGVASTTGFAVVPVQRSNKSMGSELRDRVRYNTYLENKSKN